MNVVIDGTNEISQAARERAWLVRLCAGLTGAPDAAEDLAQETLLEAWRQAHKLVEPAGRERWLAAIARNVCLRWRRSTWRTTSRLSPLEPDEVPSDTFDIEVDLERDELVELLDRALALLPPATQQVLVERYVHELPYRAIAERLGVSEDAVSMRLSRGRLLLRRVLTTELKEAAIAYDAAGVASGAWEPTRLWCLLCGRQRLHARLPQTAGTVAFQCPECRSDPDAPGAMFPLTNSHFARLLGGLQRPKVILGRASAWAHSYFRDALIERSARCTNCDRPVALHMTPSADLPALQENPLFLYAVCEACGVAVSTSFHGLVSNLPEVQRFWQAQRRIRMLQDYEIEVAGQAAIVTRYESLTSAAQLDVVSMRDPALLFDSYQATQTARQ